MSTAENRPPKGLSENEVSLKNLSDRFQAGIRVHQPGVTLPKYASFKPGVNPFVAAMVTTYLSGPTITDGFGAKHELRRDFYEKVKSADPVTFSWMEANRLRFNNMYGLSMIGPLNAGGQIDSRLVSKLNDVLPKSAEEFAQLKSDEVRVAKTEEVAEVVRKIYENLVE